MSNTPSSGKNDPIEISLDDLDGVVGGATALTKTQLNQIAGFDTSQLDLSAQAVQSGAAEAAVAHVVAAGQGTDAGAMHLLEAVATQNHLNVGQALAGFAEQITQVAGHTSDWSIVGQEVATQIAGGQITAANAFQGIEAALTGKTITADHAVSLLSGLAAAGDASLQAAVGGELTTLVARGQITAGQAMTDIDSAVAQGLMTGDHAVSVLSGVASGATVTLLKAVGSEIASLIGHNYVTADHAMADIHTAVSINKLGGDQAVALLASVATAGGLDLQTAAGREIGALVTANKVTASQAIVDVDHAVANSSHTLSPSAAVGVLAGIAAANPSAVAAASAEIGTIIRSGYLTGVQAAGALASASALDDAGVAAAAGQMIAAQIAAGTFAAADVVNSVHQGASSADREVTTLAVLGGSGNASLQSAAIAKIAALVTSGAVSNTQAMIDIGSAAIASKCTGDQAVSLMLGVATASSGTSTATTSKLGGTPAALAAAGSEIATLIASGVLGASQAMTDVASAVTAKTLTGDQAVTLLASTIAVGTGAAQTAAAGQIAGMITAGTVTATKALTDISAALTAKTITADQTVSVLTAVAGAGTPALQTTVCQQLQSMVFNRTISTTQLMTDVGATALSKGCTADQAINLLVRLGVSSNAAMNAAGAEIATLIAAGAIGASQAMADVGQATTARTISGDQAVAMIAAAIGAGSAAIQSAAAGQLAALASSGALTSSQIVTDLGTALTAKVITVDQMAGTLIGLSVAADANVQRDATAKLVSMINGATISASQAMTDLDVAVAAKVCSADQAVTLVAGIVNATGTPAVQLAASKEIGALIASGAITPAKALADIGACVGKTCTADTAVNLMLMVGGAGPASTLGAVGAQISKLCDLSIATSQVIADVRSARANGIITTDQTVAVLGSIAGAGSLGVLTTAVGEIGSMVQGGAVSATQAAADVASMATASAAAPDQIVKALTVLGASSVPGLTAAAAQQMTALIEGGTITAAQAMADVGSVVAAIGYSVAEPVVNLIVRVAVGGSAATQAAIGTEIATLITSGAISPTLAMADIGSAINKGACTADQAMNLLMRIGTSASTAIQTAVAGEIATLIASGSISATQAMADVGAAVAAKAVSADQAVMILACTAPSSASATRIAACGEIAALVSSGLVTATQAMADVAAVVTNKTITADQAVTTYALVGVAGDASIQKAAATQVAALVSTGAVTATQAMADFQGAVGTNGQTGNQAIALLAQIAAVGPGVLQSAVASEIRSLIGIGTVTTSQVMTDIGAAVAGKAVTADQAVTLLALAASGGSSDVATAALGQITAMVSSGQVTAAQAAADVAATVSSKALTADQAVLTLLTLAGTGNVAWQAAVSSQLVTMMTGTAITPALAMADIGAAVSSGTCTADQAMGILVRVCSAGNASIQAAVGTEVNTLISSGAVSASQAMADIGAAVATKVCTADQAVKMLALVSSVGTGAITAAAGAQVNALIVTGALTATQAMSDIGAAGRSAAATVTLIAAVGTSGSPTTQAAGVNQILALVASGTIGSASLAASAFGPAAKSGAITGDQAITMLAGLASAGNPVMQSEVVSQINSMINTGTIAPAQAMVDIGAAVAINLSGADQAVNLLTRLAATSAVATQTAAVGEIATLISSGTITSAQVVTDVRAAISAGNCTVDQATTLFTLLGATSSPAVQAAAGGAIAGLITGGGITAAQAIIDVARTVSNRIISADQAIGVLTSIAAAGTAAVQAAVGGQIASFVGSNVIDAGRAMADIGAAVAANALTGDQAVTVLAKMIAAGQPWVGSAAAGEIGALISAGAVTAAQAAADIGTAVTNKVITGDQAVTALAVMSTVASPGLQAAVATQLVTLVSAGTVTAAKAMTDIGAAVSGYSLSADQAITFLAGVSAAATGAIEAAVGREIVALVTSGAISAAQASADIQAAVSTKAVSADQAVGLLVCLLAGGNAAVQTAAVATIGALVDAGAVTADQAIKDVCSVVLTSAIAGNQVGSILKALSASGNVALQAAEASGQLAALVASGGMTADQAVAALTTLSSAGTVPAQTAAAAQIVALVNAGLATPAQAMTDIGAAAGAKAISLDQAIALLARISGVGSPAIQTAAATEVVALVNSGAIATGTAMTDIGAAISTELVSADQAVTLLAQIAATGTAWFQVAAANEVLAIIGAGQITAAQAAGDIVPVSSATGLTADQAVQVLAVLGASPDPTIQVAAAGRIVDLIGAGAIGATQAMTDIHAAVQNGAVWTQDASNLLARIWVVAPADVQLAAAKELAAQVVYAAGSGNAVYLLSHMDAVANHAVPGDQAVGLIATAMAAGDPSARPFLARAMTTLVTNGSVTDAQVMADVQALAASKLITIDQAVSVVAVLSTSGDADMRNAGTQELLSLMKGGVSPNTVANDVASVLSVSDAVVLMADAAGAGGATPALQATIGAALSTLVKDASGVAQIARELGASDEIAVLSGLAATTPSGTVGQAAVAQIAQAIAAADPTHGNSLFFGAAGATMLNALKQFGLDRALSVVDGALAAGSDGTGAVDHLMGPLNRLVAADVVKVSFGAMTGDAAALDLQKAATQNNVPFDCALTRLSSLASDNKAIQDLQTARVATYQAPFELFNQVRAGRLAAADAAAILATEAQFSTVQGLTAATARLNDIGALVGLSTGANGAPSSAANIAQAVISHFQAEQAAFPGHAPLTSSAVPIDLAAERWVFGSDPAATNAGCAAALSLLSVTGAITGHSAADVAHAAIDMAQFSFPKVSTLEVLLTVADKTGNDHGVLDLVHDLIDGKKLACTVHDQTGKTADKAGTIGIGDVLMNWASNPKQPSLIGAAAGADGLLSEINDAVMRLQGNRGSLATPLLPGIFQAEVTLGHLDKTISDLIVDNTVLQIQGHGDPATQAKLDVLAALDQKLLDDFGIAVSAGRSMLPLVDAAGAMVASKAFDVGQLAASTANAQDPDAQAALITDLMASAKAAHVPVDAALALAAFGAAGHSTVLNMTMTARLMGGAAQQDVMDLVYSGSLTGTQAAAILSTAVQALAASNAPDANHSGTALGFEEATARGLVLAQLSCALSSAVDAETKLASAPSSSTDVGSAAAAAVAATAHSAEANILKNALAEIQTTHGSDLIRGLGVMTGLMAGQPSVAPADAATATAMQASLSKVLASTMEAQTQQDVKVDTLTTGKLSDSAKTLKFTKDHTQDFQDAYQAGAMMGALVQTYAMVKVQGPMPEGQKGDLGSLWTNTTDMQKSFKDRIDVSMIDSNDFLKGTKTGVGATALVQASLGGVTFTAAAGASAETGAGVSKLGAAAYAQAGAFASLNMHVGPVDLTAFVEASAESRVSVGLKGISIKASVGAVAGVEIAEHQTLDMNGIEATRSTKLAAVAGATAKATASVGLMNQAKFGAFAGAYVSVTEDLTFGAGPLEATSSATLMSPGNAGASANIKVGLEGSKITFDLSAALGFELAGVGLGFKGSVDTSQAVDFVKDDISRAVELSIATYKDKGESIVNAAGSSIVGAGSAFESGASAALHAVDDAFSRGFSTVQDALNNGLNQAADGAKWFFNPGRVICTHFYRKGMLDRDTWRADLEFTYARLSPITVRGYQAWAIPYVRLMRRSPLAERLMYPLMRWRAEELAYQMGRRPKGSLAGKIVRTTLEPVCWMIGLFVGEQDWRSLWRGTELDDRRGART
ncbi:beta strand repeat-containing protein [Methyloraptor flagellatus]|uniref:Uncharacterized protein n=1 Tax=Methyloraptor flagellatus TaxID=3162530 RepID=A0AAU7X5W8_9HYPH